MVAVGHGEQADAQVRSYDLPQGDASDTLHQFARVSDQRLIFMVAKVRGVQTNAVVGEFTPAVALDRMLEGTELRVLTDPQSGGVVVTRKPKGRRNHPEKVETQPSSDSDKPMKKPNLLSRALTALSVMAASMAEAQTTPASAAADGEDVIVLSPFEVSSGSETGYVATSSLVGSRVNTELKDVASQIDVLTPEFLQDIGADSIADAVVYSSNFGGPFDQNIGVNDGVSDVSVEGRARGMDGATVSTDFFATNLPIDFYNIERLNLAYGAQSILFGLGGAGGVLDSGTKRALMRDQNSVRLKFDSWGGRREILDTNIELADEKFAIRLVGLDSVAEQFTRGGESESQRGFATFTDKPFERTTVRASYEYVDVTTQRATNYLSYDFLTPWLEAGSPLFNNARGNGSINASNPLLSRNNNALRVLSYGATELSYLPWRGSAVTLGPHQLPGVVDEGRMSLLDDSVYPTSLDPRVASRANHITGDQIRASIEQKIAEDFYLELAFNTEERDEKSGGNFDNGESLNIRVDPNMYLPGGTNASPQTELNPNAGKLYIESFPHGEVRYNSTQEARLTGYYEFDARKHLSDKLAWLGRHRLAALVSTREDRTEAQEDRALVLGETSFTTGDKLNNSRLLRTRYYLEPDSVRYAQATAVPGTDNFGPWTVTDPTTGEDVTYVLFDNPEGSAYVPVGTKVDVDTAMAALQSFFLDGRLNLFAGLRRDHVKTYYFDEASAVRQDLNTAGDEQGLYIDLDDAHYSAEPDATKTSILRTYGAVAHLRPWLSVFYNTSENTSLPPGRFGPFGNALGGTSADGYDYGLRVSLLRDRVTMRVNFFQDNQINLWSNPFNQLRNYSATIEQRLRGVDRPAGIGEVPASTFDPIGRPVDLYRSLSNKTTEGMDVVLVANLTSNWTVRATVGRQENLLKTRGQEWIAWIDQRLPVWQDAGGMGWDNVTISSDDSQTIHEYYDEQIVPQETAQNLAVGNLRFREREWRANAFTNYRFKEGRFKGLNLGGGVRWWGPGMTGNAGMDVPGIATPIDDVTQNFKHAGAQTFVDLVLGYRRKINFAGDRRTINFQVNVRNVLNKDGIEVTRTNHSGIDYEYVRIAPRQFVFSAGMDF